MRAPDFWNYFDQVASPRLARRANGFRKVFTYLDRLERPVTIVETGCVREQDNWAGDGQSTILFDKYAEFHPGSAVLSVDVDPTAVALCKPLVTRAQVNRSDSIAFLENLARRWPDQFEVLDLLYLDSHEVNLEDPLASAAHHLDELLAIAPVICPDTLVVVDDSPLYFLGVPSQDGRVEVIQSPSIGGKGRLIARYASRVGAEIYFSDYQCAWFGFGRTPSSRLKFAPPGRRHGVSQPESEPASDGSAASPTSDRVGGDDRTPGQPTLTDESTARLRSPKPLVEPRALALRIARALPRPERARLAWQLLEGEAEEVTFKRAGTRWTGLLWDEVISRNLFIDGGFQNAEVRAILAWMSYHKLIAPNRNVAIDVGANIGTFAIPFAQQTECRVVAIEPFPELYAVLARNVADNGLAARVTCIQAAICLTNEERVRMILPSVNSGAGEVCREGRGPSWADSYAARSVAEVPARKLSDVIKAQAIAPAQVALVWSDTQGREADVIESGQELWAAGVPLFAEFAPRFFPDAARELVAVANRRFISFIVAQSLIADPAAGAQPIAELAAFCQTLGRDGGDALLLPESFENCLRAKS